MDSTEGGFNDEQTRRVHQHAKGTRTPAPVTQHEHKERKVKGRGRWEEGGVALKCSVFSVQMFVTTTSFDTVKCDGPYA